MGALRRIGRNIKQRRFIEAYVVSAASVAVAALSLLGDVVDDDLRWAVVLGALGLMTYQVTLPERAGDLDEILHSRSSFEDTTFSSRLRSATEVWLYGPSLVNVLTADAAGQLRSTVLARGDGVVRVMVLDPDEAGAIGLASRQLDDSTVYPTVKLPLALSTATERLTTMASWPVAGTFEHRYAPFNPGFSVVAIDPRGKAGLVIVEFHGVYNDSDSGRMHVELTRATSERWYEYWVDQFEDLWSRARRPDAPSDTPIA
jgi:hypothetical protein